jgi:proteic killer suppression protein
MEVLRIEISKSARGQLGKMPYSIQDSFLKWVDRIEKIGIQETRKIRGYHDEPLTGDRKGQRSVRLNRAYRAIYIQRILGEIMILEVLEINKHRY